MLKTMNFLFALVLMLAVVGCQQDSTDPISSNDFSGSTLSKITFDAETGTGFVGKGDVQYTFGWNNHALQANANNVAFRVNSVVVTEVSWICTNSNNQNEQIRERTTTTTIQGVVGSIARERNQITGFILNGYDGDPEVDTETEGNQLNSCPGGPWTLTTPAGDPEVVSETGGFEVSALPTFDWTELLEKPVL